MKKAKYLFCFLLVLFAAAVFLCIRFYPCYQGAGYLQETVDLQRMSFDITVSLSKEKLTEEQTVFLRTMGQITGIPEESLLRLRLKGQTWQDIIYVQVIPSGNTEGSQGGQKPLTELYLSSGTDLLNGAMLYAGVHDNLINRYGIPDLFVPEWSGGEYVALEQAEQMFDLDLSGAREFSMDPYEAFLSPKKYFVLLAVMENGRDEEGNRMFSLKQEPPVKGVQEENVTLELSLLDRESTQQALLQGSVKDLGQALQDLDAMFSRIGVTTSFGQKKGLQYIESLEGEILMGGGQEMEMPDSVIQQDTADKITALRTILQDLAGGRR